ncbi:MAG: hypothetical protein IJ079_04030 [Lachnospiraceae bacterium]|nr:hypothetical protein [Lachnospiraceae bacterium]
MRTYKVVLCDPEEEYILALMNYINRNTQIPVLAMAFTEAHDMYSYLAEHKADLIFADCIPDEWQENVDRGTKVIYIYTSQKDKPEGVLGIYKYSPASEYVHSMLQVFSEEEQVVQSGIGGCSIAVYSPHGRSGKTMLAKALCAYYSRQSMQAAGCIYLGMEEYGFRKKDDHAMEELLYYIKQRTGNISMKMKTLAKDCYGYDLITGSSFEELRELNEEDLKWLIEAVQKEGLYEKVVVDIGSGSLSDLKLLQYFNVVYIPRLRDSDSEQKWKTFCITLDHKEMDESLYHRWYPVYVEPAGISAQDVQSMEYKREHGELRSVSEDIVKNREASE